LFGTERDGLRGTADKRAVMGRVELGGIGKPCFTDNVSEERTFQRPDFQYFLPEKFHGWGITGKPYGNQVGRNIPVGMYLVGLMGLMENDIVFIQRIVDGTGRHICHTFVYTKKFPEIMGFFFKNEIIDGLKIMDGNNFINDKFLF